MLHALRLYVAAFGTARPDVKMWLGPSIQGDLLEIGVLSRDDASRCRSCDESAEQVPERMDRVSHVSDDEVKAFEEWADRVTAAELRPADMGSLRLIAPLADERARLDRELTAAVVASRQEGHSWAMIGVMLGVSKQAAQQKYGAKAASAAGDGRARPAAP